MSTTHASRPTRDKHSKVSSTDKMKADGPQINKVQPTAEQMQLARMISNDNNKEEDPELMSKIRKVQELTHATEDDALFALYDVNYDLNRAVEKLLENSDIQKEWRKISKKEKSQQAAKVEPTVNNTKNEGKHEKNKDREVTPKSDNAAPRNRRDRGPPRFQRGRGRERAGTDEETNKTDNVSRERSFDRGERGGRGRGRGGPGRGRGRGRSYRGARFDSSKDKGPHIDTWTNEQAETSAEKENIGSWGDMTEDWTTEDWQGSKESGDATAGLNRPLDQMNTQLEESKVFTPSNANEGSNIFSSMNDNDAKMFTPPSSIETQVFTASSLANSSTSGTLNESTNSFQHSGSSHQQNAVSQGTIGHNALNQNSLGPSPLGQRLDLNTLFPKAAENSSPMNQQHAPFMSQFAKEATESIKNAVGIGSPAAGQQVSIGLSQANDVSRNMAPTAGQPNHQQTVSQPQQQRAKTQRTKLPPPSKIPASAVEMPGSMNFQLDVQFGNWDQSTDGGNGGLGFGNVISTSPVSTNYASSVQSVAASKSQLTSMPVLDGLPQSVSQSSHNTGLAYQNSTTPNPPKDYTQPNLKTPVNSSTADSAVFPTTQTDRKASPYSSQRTGQTAGSSAGSKPVSSAMTYSQSSYSCSYPSSYKPSLTSTSTYSHSANGLNSGSLSQSAPSQYNSSGSSYQSSSFQNQTGFSSNPTQSSLYQGSGSQSNAYSAQSGSSSAYSTGSSVYQGQGSYPSQSNSSYPSQSYSRDSSQAGSAAYQSGGVSQSTSSAYQPGAVSQSGTSGYQSSAVSQSGSSGYHSSVVSQSVSSVYQSGGMNQSSSSGYPAGGINQSGSSAYQSTSTTQSGSSYPASVSQAVTPVSSTGYQRDSQSSQVNYGHQAYATQNSASKLSDNMAKISMKDAALDGQSSQFDHSSSSVSSASLTTTTSTTASSLASGNVSISSSLGLPGTTTSTTGASSTTKNAMPVTTKVPPNLPPGVPLIQNYMIGQPGIAPFAFAGLAQQPMYSYEDLQLLQQRLPLPGYTCDMPLQPATTLTGRDQAAPLTQAPYSTSSENKMTRVDAQSPVTAQTTQQQQTPSAHQQQQQQQQQQQAFINATLPPGYNYYYPTGSVLPGGYSYPATMFPLSVTNTAHGGTTASVQFQKPGTYGTHAYGTGGQNQDFAKTYSGASSGQNKVSSGSIVSSTATDLTGTGASYGKSHTQSFDKPGFHAGTPPPFSIPLPTGTQAGPMGGPTAYGTPYVPVMAHQPHSQMLHHPLQQDSSGGSGRSSQQSATQNKGAVGKSFPNYWGPN